MIIYHFSGDDYITDTVEVSSFESAREFFPLRHVTLQEGDLVLIAQLVTEDQITPGSVFATDFDFTAARDLRVHALLIENYQDYRGF